jgi:hypothetical protein
MKAYNARAIERIQVEPTGWIEVGEVVTITPCSRNLAKVDIWYNASAIYCGIDADRFEVISVISAS